MGNERKRILNLVENGTISAEEAIVLLEALSKDKNSTTSSPTTPSTMTPAVVGGGPEQKTPEQPKQEQFTYEQTTDYTSSHQQTQHDSTNEGSKSKSGFEDLFGSMFKDNKKMDEFMNEVRKDLTQFSSRMSDFLNTTLSKVKDVDLEFPFGSKMEFDKSYAFDAAEIKGIELDIPNGKVELVKAEDERFLVEAHIKASYSNQDEEQAKEKFAQEFVTFLNGKLTISTTAKMSQVTVKLMVPAKHYDVVLLRLMNGSISVSNLDATLLKVKTYNGGIKIEHVTFKNADIHSGNGAIELRHIKGEDLEAETVNGRVYIDGDLQEVEAESVNGAVVITTTSEKARKVKARTVAGVVELYIPKTLSLNGQVSTNFGKIDVGLADIERRAEDEQLLQKTVRFDKLLENVPVLKVSGESRSGSIIIRYLA